MKIVVAVIGVLMLFSVLFLLLRPMADEGWGPVLRAGLVGLTFAACVLISLWAIIWGLGIGS